jgi:ribose-phosphate pyrophosphokinase
VSVPIVFALPGFSELLGHEAVDCAQVAVGSCELARFSNGELYCRIGDPVADRVCAVLGSLAPPDEQTLSALLLADTLRREGARQVVALLPYLGYARQDNAEAGQSLGAAWVGALLQAAGVGRVVTVDVHSRQAAACFPMPLDSLSPASLFAAALRRRGLSDLMLVAPDEGARERCAALGQALEAQSPTTYLHKRRDREGVTHSTLLGAVGPRLVIVDDILDTGSTLVSACSELRRAGAREITVVATHALFSGERWRGLPALGVRRIYTTDSVPGARQRGGDIVEVLPVGRLLLDTFAAGAHVS